MKPALLYMVDDLRRVAAEDSQLARWDLEDCEVIERRMAESCPGFQRDFFQSLLGYLQRRAIGSQLRAARHYARARTILGID